MNWISTKESIPQHGLEPYRCTPYLVSVDMGPDFELDDERYSVWYAIRCGGPGRSIAWYGLSTDGHRVSDNNLEYSELEDKWVVAWMPLPDSVHDEQEPK